jgi:hypothetical protein
MPPIRAGYWLADEKSLEAGIAGIQGAAFILEVHGL